jgi:hypothetical protein
MDPTRSTAFAPDQIAYLLEVVDPAAPFAIHRVLLTAFEPLEIEGEIVKAGDILRTRHATELRKQLPDRRVVSILEGGILTDGDEIANGQSFPHWELMVGTTEDEVTERIAANRARLAAAKPKEKKAEASKSA